MKFLRCFSIRTKMSIIILAVGFPVVLAACFHLYVMYNADYKRAEQTAIVTARSMAYQYNTKVEGIRNLLTALSQFPEVKNRDKKACTGIIRNILHQNTSSLNIGIADLKGNIIVSGIPARFNIGDRKFFRDALHSKRFSAGEYALSRAAGKPAINFALPVLNPAGEPVAVLYAAFDLNQFNRIFDSQKLPTHSVLNLTDNRGFILHHYPDRVKVEPGFSGMPVLRGHVADPNDEGVFVDSGPDGVKRLTAFKRLRLNPGDPPYIYIGVSTPETAVLEGVNRYIVRSVLMFSLVALFATALIHFLIGRLFVSPIEHMASVAGAVTNGDLSIRTGLQDSGAEIGLLANSFDTMTAALDKRLRERARAEDRLKAKEAQLRALVDNLPFHLWAMYPNGRYFMQNSLSQECWGNFIGKKPDETAVPKEILNKWHNSNYRAFAGEVVKGETEYAVNGENRHFYYIIAPIKTDHTVLGIMGVYIDINDRKSLESQLYQAQKMEAVGQLAGGIAHDFNNILTAIIGYAHFMTFKMAEDDPLYNCIGQILKCADRAAELTQGLLVFSRKQIMLPQIIRINDVVAQQQKMLRMLIGENIDLKLELDREALAVSADKVKIEQVLLNLMANARDAMPNGGSIVISTSSMIMNDEFVHKHGYGVPGEYACISVRDTGCGMDPETRKKIFEPFFTTKEVGKGTGLGLAIVYGIVKQHNGYINVYSERDKGTIFTIYLPMAPAKDEPATAIDVKYFPSGRKETLLLAEDDPEVCCFHKTLLEEAGYAVISAADGKEAFSKFIENENRVNLLVLDVMMPGMNGSKVFELARERNPESKALFMSGYPREVLDAQGILQERCLFMMKPISPGKLLESVREILDT